MPTVNQLQRRLKRDSNYERDILTLEIENSGFQRDEDAPEVRTIEVPTEIWQDPHPVLEIKEGDLKKKVWIAGKPSTFDAILMSIDKENGEVEVLIKDQRADRGFESVRNFFMNEVILHPDELTEERLSEYFTVQDLRKV